MQDFIYKRNSFCTNFFAFFPHNIYIYFFIPSNHDYFFSLEAAEFVNQLHTTETNSPVSLTDVSHDIH